MAASVRASNRYRLTKATRLFLIVFALLAIVGGGWLYANRDSARLTIFKDDAGDLLTRVVADSKLPVSEAGAVDQIGADGTQPDMAMQTLTIPASPEAVRAGFLRACQQSGLGKADAATLGSEPDALCGGDWQGGKALVSVQLGCTSTCRAQVTVQHLWF